MEIRHITNRKKDFLDLLLLADESEMMIERYLDRGEMFALYDEGLKSICVVTQEGQGLYEIKNLATWLPVPRSSVEVMPANLSNMWKASIPAERPCKLAQAIHPSPSPFTSDADSVIRTGYPDSLPTTILTPSSRGADSSST